MVMVRVAANKPSITIRLQPKQLLIMLTLVLLLYVVVPQIGSIGQSVGKLQHANLIWVMLGALSYMSSNLFSVGVYRLLSPRHLPFWRTALVQYGGNFANRLLPAGLGALGVDYFYLRKQKCTRPAALATILLNNILGAVGHVVLLIGIILLVPDTFFSFRVNPQLSSDWWLIVLAVASLATILLLVGRIRQRVIGAWESIWSKLRAYRTKKRRVLLALVVSLFITLAHSICLWATSKALGVHLLLAQAIVVLGVGVLLGAVIPSPGGLGGAEAGLVAALVAFAIPVGSAIAVAILYRLATYWLGFVAGAITFPIVAKRSYI